MAKILVVDDEPGIAVLLTSALHRAGFKVVEAYSGAQAIQVAQQDRPDLVLLDVMLPDLDGREVCAFLKGCDDLRDMRVLLVSEASEDNIRWRDAGADGFVPKGALGPMLELVRAHLQVA